MDVVILVIFFISRVSILGFEERQLLPIDDFSSSNLNIRLYVQIRRKNYDKEKGRKEIGRK